MIKIQEKINNGAITTIKGVIVRDTEIICFIFNGNKTEFRIDAQKIIPEYGLFSINFIIEKSEDNELCFCTKEEISEILSYVEENNNITETYPKIDTDTEDEEININYVSSSVISIIAYKASESKLYISFKDNLSMYEYLKVPKLIFENFLKSESKGRYFNECIKNKFHTNIVSVYNSLGGIIKD